LKPQLLKFFVACILLTGSIQINKSYGAVTYTVSLLNTYLSPNTLLYGESGQIVFGFQIKAVVTGTATTIATMVIPSNGGNAQSFFGNGTSGAALYTTARGTTAGANLTYPTDFTNSGAGIDIEASSVTFSNLNQACPVGTSYYNYYFAVSYNQTYGTAPSTVQYHISNGAFFVRDPSYNTTYTSTNSITGTSYAIGGIFDWVGTTNTDVTNRNNYRMNGSTPSVAPGANDLVRFGVVGYQSPAHQPTIDANTSLGEIEFGSNNSPTITITNNTVSGTVFGFPVSYYSYTLSLSQGLIIDANANPVIKSSATGSTDGFVGTYGTSVISVTGTSTIASTASLTLGNQITLTNTGDFTLLSDASGSASMLCTPATAPLYTVNGNINVQRYIPGGSAQYRGYRLLTLPVNATGLNDQSTTEGVIDLHSLNTGMLTAGPGTGYSYATKTANPLMYLYDESRAQNFSTYLSGKDVGIYTLATGTPYKDTYYPKNATAAAVPTATAVVPVGNSVQIYYVGPSTEGNLSDLSPPATTTTSTGYLNQGTIPVYIFSTGTKKLSYSTAVNTAAQGLGLNQVGNPYPATIDLDDVYADNKTGGTAIGPTFWELKYPGNTFVAYNGSTHAASIVGSGAEAYVASGQGFFVQAMSTNSALTFYEDEKVSTNLGTSTTPVLILNQQAKSLDSAATESTMPAAVVSSTSLSGLHLQISKDVNTYTQTGIYFNSTWSDKYTPTEDAIDLDGTAPKVYLSSYSQDGTRLCINQLGDYSKGKTVKLYASATTSGTYTLSLADIKNIDTLYNVYLRDNKLNDSVNLRKTNSYNFNIITSDTTTFGANRFDLVIAQRPLPPYQLITFAGQKVNSGIQVNWKVLNEGNYTGFTLQKLSGNNNYNSIDTLQSNNASTYDFVDRNPILGNNVYRLQQNDINGNISYSSAITIGYNAISSNGYFNLYPNPVKDILNVSINSTATTVLNYTADIYNTSGILIDHRSLNTNTWTEDVSSYKLGIYIIELKSTNGDLLGKSKFIKTQ
jgi:trimeric autotransporter adhesin